MTLRAHSVKLALSTVVAVLIVGAYLPLASASPGTGIELRNTQNRTVLWGDFNGDGFDDLVVFGDSSASDVSIFDGSASGLSLTSTALGLPLHTYGRQQLAAADFNGDGFDDDVQ